ncbi:MAG: sialate O-acetylesterase, partial [Verrucomicrobiales bacterium]|nr:sialate O-acetylesterase [Verrucomicrobiales bacterium]
MHHHLKPIYSLALAATTAAAAAQTVPAHLPDPDGQPGDTSKPVKVYILAGQSNMVGMGDLSGAKNVYTGVFYSSDPAVPEGPQGIFKVGNYKFGRCTVYLPDGTRTGNPVAKGLLEVPQTGTYRANAGSATIQFDGQPTAATIDLQAGKRYPFTITGHRGSPPHFWLQKTDLLGNGDLEAIAKREGKFPWIVDANGDWSVRHDVYFQEARLAEDGKGSPLSATSNGRSIGPEQGFGHVLGTFHDEQVLLIKTAQGNRSLGFDFRPPSSGRTDPDSEFESAEYKLMVEGVRKTLANIETVVPGYKGQGYEIAGFAWFQGHKDSGSEQSIAGYQKHLANLIDDVRGDFGVPKLPAVVATIGFGGHQMAEKYLAIHQAQMAVGDPEKHPEYAGNVASVDTRDFWREVDESPTNQDYHYNRNAETYLL